MDSLRSLPPPAPGLRRALYCAAVLVALLAAPGRTQEVIDVIEHLDWDEPEAWGLKFFTATSLFSSIGDTTIPEVGRWELGFEVLSVPHLSQRERTIGFDGRKEEDLNRSPVWGRARVRVGLPAGFAVSLGVGPPLEVDGIKAELFALALDKRLHESERLRFGLRHHAQLGDVSGDLTCTPEDAAEPPGSPGNFFGCLAPSDDEATLEYQALEANLTFPSAGRGPDWHLALTAARVDGEFQVNAQVFDVIDHTRLLADGWIYALAGGVTFDLSPRLVAGGELFYAPLSVRRPPELDRENDPLFNLRVLLRYRLGS